MGGHDGSNPGLDLVCVDAVPEQVGTNTDRDSALWHYAEARRVAGQSMRD